MYLVERVGTLQFGRIVEQGVGRAVVDAAALQVHHGHQVGSVSQGHGGEFPLGIAALAGQQRPGQRRGHGQRSRQRGQFRRVMRPAAVTEE